jgi:hypothetical protein
MAEIVEHKVLNLPFLAQPLYFSVGMTQLLSFLVDIAYSVVSSHTSDPKLLGLVAARINGLAIAILVNTWREKFCAMTYPA